MSRKIIYLGIISMFLLTGLTTATKTETQLEETKTYDLEFNITNAEYWKNNNLIFPIKIVVTAVIINRGSDLLTTEDKFDIKFYLDQREDICFYKEDVFFTTTTTPQTIIVYKQYDKLVAPGFDTVYGIVDYNNKIPETDDNEEYNNNQDLLSIGRNTPKSKHPMFSLFTNFPMLQRVLQQLLTL